MPSWLPQAHQPRLFGFHPQKPSVFVEVDLGDGSEEVKRTQSSQSQTSHRETPCLEACGIPRSPVTIATSTGVLEAEAEMGPWPGGQGAPHFFLIFPHANPHTLLHLHRFQGLGQPSRHPGALRTSCEIVLGW